MSSENESLPQRARGLSLEEIEAARRLWREAQCHDLVILQRCLEGLRGRDTEPPPETPPPAAPAAGPQDQVDRVIERWRADHEPAGARRAG